MEKPITSEAQDSIQLASDRFDSSSKQAKHDMFREACENAIICEHCATIAAVGKMSSQHYDREIARLNGIIEILTEKHLKSARN